MLRAAAELGLRVPVELSVMGFDDSSLALRLAPPLVVRGTTAPPGPA